METEDFLKQSGVNMVDIKNDEIDSESDIEATYHNGFQLAISRSQKKRLR